MRGPAVNRRTEGTRVQQKYILVGCRPWNRPLFDEVISKYEGEWHFIGSRDELTSASVHAINPRFVFFLHWSWKVPDEIVNRFECVCFHMTDVPYGRGGSPLQNLILRGHRETKVSALRMTSEFDAGPVYCKETISLEGAAGEIYIRAGEIAARMIARIIREQMTPVPQAGEAVIFKRRKPEESNIAELRSLSQIYDYIRMLDAEEYPHAFLEAGAFRFEFRKAAQFADRVEAQVTIIPVRRDRE
jgi:methionyl-tRNA formyltransferase